MEPKFAPFDLTEFLESGNLLAVNEKILWKMGLALTVTWDTDTKKATGLFVSQWVHPDGHQEIIEDSRDEITDARHAAYEKWVRARADLMENADERAVCLSVLE